MKSFSEMKLFLPLLYILMIFTAASLASVPDVAKKYLLRFAGRIVLRLEEIRERHRSVGDVRHIGLFGAVELVKELQYVRIYFVQFDWRGFCFLCLVHQQQYYEIIKKLSVVFLYLMN